jgi:RNA polymerase primary sigma factor
MRQLKITHKITTRESLALDKYLTDIGKIPMLAGDEEAELARRIRDGDQEALDKLTRSNLRFVVSVGKAIPKPGSFAVRPDQRRQCRPDESRQTFR